METDTAPVLARDGHRGGRGLPLVATIALASLANALNQADRNIMPIAVIPMAEELGLTLLERGMVLSAFAYGYILVQIPSGWIATRLPALELLLGAVAGWSVSVICTPAAAHAGLGALFVCRVAMGLAEGFCLPAIFQHFSSTVGESRRSGAFAVMLASGSVGQLAALLFCPLIAPWGWMFYSFGLAGLAWCASCAVALGCSGQRGERADEIEPRPYGAGSVSSSSDGSGGNSSGGDGDGAGGLGLARRKAASARTPWRRLVGCREVQAIVAAHFAQNWANYTMSAWFPTYLHDVHGVRTDQLWLTAVPFAVSAVAGTCFGLAADAAIARRRCSVLDVRRAATLAGLLGPAACLVLLGFASSASAAVAIMTLSGFLGSATSCGYMANHADLSTRFAGLTFGIANTAATVPGLVAGPLTATLLRGEAGPGAPWGLVFGVSAAINVAGAAVYRALGGARRVL